MSPSSVWFVQSTKHASGWRSRSNAVAENARLSADEARGCGTEGGSTIRACISSRSFRRLWRLISRRWSKSESGAGSARFRRRLLGWEGLESGVLFDCGVVCIWAG
jgi:hypothetical protein